MNSIKKIGLGILLVAGSVSGSIWDEDASYDDLLDAAAANNLHSTRAPCTADSALDFIISVVPTLPELIRLDLWHKTISPFPRSILDYPMFEWYLTEYCGVSLQITPFFNQTGKQFLTKSSPFIEDYINFTGKDVLDLLIGPFMLLDNQVTPEQVVPLFGQITLQERRLGAMFQLGANYTDWIFKFYMPFYYFERNFYLSPDQIEKIRDAPLIRDVSPSSTEDETRELMIQHLVSDQLGFGDMRFSVLYALYTGEEHAIALGAQVTFPTAFAVKQGLIGNFFSRNKTVPAINIRDLADSLSKECGFTIAEQEAVKNDAMAFMFGALDRLTATASQFSLGTGGSVIFAPLLQYDFFHHEWLRLTTKGTIQFNTPHRELRSYMKVTNQRALNLNYKTENEEEAARILAIVSARIYEMFIPEALPTRVTPGMLLELSQAATFSYRWFSLTLGLDFWHRDHEKIRLLCTPTVPVHVDDARVPSAYQFKAFGSLYGMFDELCDSLKIGLQWDATFLSKGIGKDFTLALDFNWLF